MQSIDWLVLRSSEQAATIRGLIIQRFISNYLNLILKMVMVKQNHRIIVCATPTLKI
ncbi:MAG: hypothetical protein DSM106950_22245 [Stigonema ocellatum SAG 48.90 = DSM 106950]|nr:hypothetical protein [Stigonema ocellatum SAG 48.90 = DSM 106950]